MSIQNVFLAELSSTLLDQCQGHQILMCTFGAWIQWFIYAFVFTLILIIFTHYFFINFLKVHEFCLVSPPKRVKKIVGSLCCLLCSTQIVFYPWFPWHIWCLIQCPRYKWEHQIQKPDAPPQSLQLGTCPASS